MDKLEQEKWNKEGNIELFISKVKKLINRSPLIICPSADIIKVFSLDLLPQTQPEVSKFKIFNVNMCKSKLVIVRLYFHKISGTGVIQTNIRIILNEMMSNCEVRRNNSCIDFVFTPRGRLLGFLPIPFISLDEKASLCDLGKTIARAQLEKLNVYYYDCTELWIDLKKIQPSSIGRLNYIKTYKRKAMFFKSIVYAYLESIYGLDVNQVKAYGKTTYVCQYRTIDGCYFKNLSLDEFETYIANGKLDKYDIEGAKVYVALPGAYTPGKYIDIGYYDAIYEEEFNLNCNDNVLVIGFGSGIDLIHSLERANLAYGIELNPFAVASANVNLKIAGLQEGAIIDWNDARELAKGNIRIPKDYYKKITKILWSMPYESPNPIRNPLVLEDFFDNYSVFEWFGPFMRNSDIFATKWSALLWNTVDGLQSLKMYFEKYGFRVVIHEDKNICIVSNYKE